MREIIPKQLWLGHALDARDLRRIHDLGIRAIVDLAMEEPVAQLSRDLNYCRFPLSDGAGNSVQILKLAIQTTSSFVSNEVPTLVACSAGMSRSPAILAASLAVWKGVTPEECLAEVIHGQPHDISPPLWADILQATHELSTA